MWDDGRLYAQVLLLLPMAPTELKPLEHNG
jgi:hypothetical protein